MSLTESILTGIPGNPLAGLRQADALWQAIRTHALAPSDCVHESSDLLPTIEWDLVVCGGTLGVLIAAALANKGWRVALLERGVLRGRSQEWNISRRELQTFLDLELLTEAELNAAIATEYNPARIAFAGSEPIWVRDVLNVGVDPVALLESLKQTFQRAKGQLFEHTPFTQATVHPNGVTITAGSHQLTTRLVLDAMGHFSPLTQLARQGQRPDAVCLVVGTCAKGYPDNPTGDLIATFTPIRHHCQYFWEAFPARDGRTTYLFTYVDADVRRPSLEWLFEEYFTLLPTYQRVTLESLQVQRALFGFFPCYRNSPLKPKWNRILPAGDSSGGQSPLSFGGFGAMVRHLPRLSQGIEEALQVDGCDRASLALLQPYQPNLSVTWLFQRAMSVGVDQAIPPDQINSLLAAIFRDMAELGDPVLKPFLQDVVQFPALAQTLAKASLSHPTLVLQVLPQVGLPLLADWLRHYLALAGYAALYPLGRWLDGLGDRLSPRQRFAYRRWLEALQYGSGGDYHAE